MNSEDQRVYNQLRVERENLRWFRTPPSLPSPQSLDTVELVKRVLAHQQREAEVLVDQQNYELLSSIPDPEETLWSLEMREHTRMAYRAKSRKEKCYGTTSVGPRSLPTRYYNL